MDEPRGTPPEQGFEAAYRGLAPPWDIGRPQPALSALAQTGVLVGPVLDIGCGTGEHALMAAELGLEAVGIDASPTAVAIAQRKAAERGLEVDFLVADALDLAGMGRRFGTVLDSGLFHTLSDLERARYEAELREILVPGGRYVMLAFSDRQPGLGGPRRLSEAEIRAVFDVGWRIETIERARMETNLPGTIEAWLVSIIRV